MKFLKPLLLIATTMMIVSAEIATAAGPIQASKRMLEYTYSKQTFYFARISATTLLSPELSKSLRLFIEG